jgi:hypothetical protein
LNARRLRDVKCPLQIERRAFDQHQRLTFRDTLWFTSIRLRGDILLNDNPALHPLCDAQLARKSGHFPELTTEKSPHQLSATVNSTASRACHAQRISYCFLSGFLKLCNAQKPLDIRWRHLKIGSIAAMHNSSRSGQTNLRLATTQCGLQRWAAIQERKP